MAMIPIATTTISVLSPPDLDVEPYSGTEDADLQVTATGVRAVIDAPGGRVQLGGGEQSVWDFQLVCDLVQILRTDTVRDDTGGTLYEVVWVITYVGDHVEAGLRLVQGEV